MFSKVCPFCCCQFGSFCCAVLIIFGGFFGASWCHLGGFTQETKWQKSREIGQSKTHGMVLNMFQRVRHVSQPLKNLLLCPSRPLYVPRPQSCLEWIILSSFPLCHYMNQKQKHGKTRGKQVQDLKKPVREKCLRNLNDLWCLPGTSLRDGNESLFKPCALEHFFHTRSGPRAVLLAMSRGKKCWLCLGSISIDRIILLFKIWWTHGYWISYLKYYSISSPPCPPLALPHGAHLFIHWALGYLPASTKRVRRIPLLQESFLFFSMILILCS